MEFRGIVRRLAGAGLVAAAGATLLVGGATGAQALPQPFEVLNGNAGNLCMDHHITSGKGRVFLGVCDGTASQQWHIAGGKFSNASGHCLDGNGGQVYTFPCQAGNPYQQWTTTAGNPKSIRHSQSGKYLHGNGNPNETLTFKPTLGTASRWVFRD